MTIAEILTNANDAPEYWEVLGHYVEQDEDIIRDGHEYVRTVDGVRHAIHLKDGRFVSSFLQRMKALVNDEVTL